MAVDRSGLRAVGDHRPVLLVLRALGLGDLLAAVPALRGLRRAFPRHRVVLCCPASLAPLALLTGAVDEVLPVPGLDPPPWPGRSPDLAVNLHGRGPESHRALLALLPGRLWAFAHSSCPDVCGPAWVEEEHEVHRWCRLLESYEVAADPGDLDLRRPPEIPSLAPGAVVVHPGAAYPGRRWPADRFAAVAASLAAEGHRVVVTGAAAERDLAVAVADGAGIDRGEVLAGRTGTLDLAALVADARLVVCGDTGVGHLATAYRTPSLLLFGPTPPQLWGPPPERAEHVALWHGTGPGDPKAPATDPALLRIPVGEVLATARGLLAGTAPGRRTRAAAAT